MQANDGMSKVLAVTLGFWVIKTIATTLGEAGGDAVSMTLNWGYALSSTMFIGIFAAAVADFADRSLGVGYPGGSLILLAGLMASLGVWYWQAGSISVNTVASPRIEMFYWTAILFSQTLGTALGDWMADTNGLGYERGALVFAGALVVVAATYFFTNISRTLLFWSAFILTRPLGATVGDFLDKPKADGGLSFGRFDASAVLVALIVALIVFVPQRAAPHPSRG